MAAGVLAAVLAAGPAPAVAQLSGGASATIDRAPAGSAWAARIGGGFALGRRDDQFALLLPLGVERLHTWPVGELDLSIGYGVEGVARIGDRGAEALAVFRIGLSQGVLGGAIELQPGYGWLDERSTGVVRVGLYGSLFLRVDVGYAYERAVGADPPPRFAQHLVLFRLHL